MQAVSIIRRLAVAIGYPEEVPEDAVSFTFLVDDADVDASAEGARLVLRRTLAIEPEAASLAKFAGYAAGRLMKEEAAIAWDPREKALVLWQECPVSADDDLLRRFFEVFLTSCDWWAARAGEQGEGYQSIPEMKIMP